MALKLLDPSLNHSREIASKAVGGGISTVFRYHFRPETDNDVISGVSVDNVGMDVQAIFGDSRSNGFRDI